MHKNKGHSTKLTKENFNVSALAPTVHGLALPLRMMTHVHVHHCIAQDWIKGEVDAGRTAMVRWIASEG